MFEMNRDEIDSLLATELIGRLAMAGADGRPYAIPMPFCWKNGALYLRLPMKGRKARILEENDRVCFEVDWTTPDLSNYASVLIEGRLIPVENLREKRQVRLCNELKYRQLRGAGRKGHGRTTDLADLALSKIVVWNLSGRKKERTRFSGIDAFGRSEGCPVCGAGKSAIGTPLHPMAIIEDKHPW